MCIRRKKTLQRDRETTCSGGPKGDFWRIQATQPDPLCALSEVLKIFLLQTGPEEYTLSIHL